MKMDKMKEVAKHLRGDIRTFKKEAGEDRELIKSLSSTNKRRRRRGRYGDSSDSEVSKKLNQDPRGFQGETRSDRELARKTSDPMRRNYKKEQGNRDEYAEEKEEFAEMQRSPRTREPITNPRKIDYPDYPEYSGTNMTRQDIEDEEKEAHMKSLSKEKRKEIMSQVIKKNMKKYGSKWTRETE